MIDYQSLFKQMQDSGDANLVQWAEDLPAQIAMGLDAKRFGDIPKWQAAVAQLPSLNASVVELDQATVKIGSSEDIVDSTQHALKEFLMQLHPWRKGPFELFGIHIDTEWRSDWKWDRLKGQIQSLQGRKVLDVGCGNGYHCWRMAGSGAGLVMGIDPTPRFIFQYQIMRGYLLTSHLDDLSTNNGFNDNVFVLPLGIDDVPQALQSFDTVFSMGVLYHRRSPLDHILQLKDCLRSGGELVLETLVIEGGDNEALLPKDRYAKMNNVWFIPTPQQLVQWVRRCGFTNVRVIDVTKTSCEEQHATEWMRFHSLADFLDPDDPSKTVEGYPAPQRAIVLAEKI